MDSQNKIAKIRQYNFRQIRLMYKKIDLFENKKIDLFDLVSDLRGFLNVLESFDETWKEAVQTELNTLEMVYDSIVDGSISRWREDPKEVEKNSIFALKKIISATIEDYLKSPDLSILAKAEIIDNNWLICPNCTNAWESTSKNELVVCPQCEHFLHNPRYLCCPDLKPRAI